MLTRVTTACDSDLKVQSQDTYSVSLPFKWEVKLLGVNFCVSTCLALLLFSYRKFSFSGKPIPCVRYKTLFPHNQRNRHMSWDWSPCKDEGHNKGIYETKAGQSNSAWWLFCFQGRWLFLPVEFCLLTGRQSYRWLFCAYMEEAGEMETWWYPQRPWIQLSLRQGYS